jgi:hypothetical protein
MDWRGLAMDKKELDLYTPTPIWWLPAIPHYRNIRGAAPASIEDN